MATNMERILEHIDSNGFPKDWKENLTQQDINKVWVVCGKSFRQYRLINGNFREDAIGGVRQIYESPEDMCLYLATEKDELSGIICRNKDNLDEIEEIGFKKVGTKKLGGVECAAYMFDSKCNDTCQPLNNYIPPQTNHWRTLARVCR